VKTALFDDSRLKVMVNETLCGFIEHPVVAFCFRNKTESGSTWRTQRLRYHDFCISARHRRSPGKIIV